MILPSLKVPSIFLLSKTFLKEHNRKMAGTFKEGRVSFLLKAFLLRAFFKASVKGYFSRLLKRRLF